MGSGYKKWEGSISDALGAVIVNKKQAGLEFGKKQTCLPCHDRKTEL